MAWISEEQRTGLVFGIFFYAMSFVSVNCLLMHFMRNPEYTC